VTKIDAGVRQSDRSVSVEEFHLFSPFYGGTPGAVQLNGTPVPAAGCYAQWKAIDVVMSQNQCQAGEVVSNSAYNSALPTGTALANCTDDPFATTNPRSNTPTCFQGYTVNRPTKIDAHNNVIWMDDLGSITQGMPGFWVVDPHDFDDVKSFQEKVFGAAVRYTVPGTTYDVTLKEQSAYANADFEIGKLSGNVGLRVIQTNLLVKQNLTGATQNYGNTNLDTGDESPLGSTPTGCRR
jgi:hypothetical protein